MSVDYRVKAYPTKYKGRMYRSRLEARWAAFFDLLGWPAEYEPFDLGEWSPDFLLARLGWQILCEVKPITEFDEAVGDKMARASYASTWSDEGSVLLLGASPQRYDAGDAGGMVSIGWYGCLYSEEPKADWQPAWLCWVPNKDAPGFRPDILRLDPSELATGNIETWSCGLDDDFGRANGRRPLGYPDFSMELWAKATNAVQWKPKT